MTEKEDRFGSARAMNARHQIAFAIVGAEDEHILFGEAGFEQALRHGVGCNRGTAYRIGSIDFDQLFKDIVRELFGLRVQLG
jgi:hypothetical protein